MSMIDRSLDGMAFLSGQLGAILRRRLRELGGIALISLDQVASASAAIMARLMSAMPPTRRCTICSAAPAPSPPIC